MRAVICLLLVPVACGPGVAQDELSVFAASSLTEVLQEIGSQSDRDPIFNFGASSTLARQIIEGAPTDVFVSADEANMNQVVAQGAATNPALLARNKLAIIVERENPKRITTLKDLENPDLIVVLCAEQVPCGSLAEKALKAAGVGLKPASYEDNVKSVVTKVILGEADAGIVYETDVKAAGSKAAGVALDSDQSLEAHYLAAVVTSSRNKPASNKFIQLLLSTDGQQTLRKFGFLPP